MAKRHFGFVHSDCGRGSVRVRLQWHPDVMPNMSHCQITRSTRFARHVGIIKPNPNPTTNPNPNPKL